jgi:molecular chaperone HtpG
MDIRMERFLMENKQIQGKMAKIFEINTGHKIIKSLVKDLKTGKGKKKVEDAIHLLYWQAGILEGDAPTDASGFSQKMNKMLEKALAA